MKILLLGGSLALFTYLLFFLFLTTKGQNLKYSVICHIPLVKQNLRKQPFSQMSNISSVLTENDR